MSIEPVMSVRPVLAILIPFICAMLILITGEKKRNLREAWSIIASICTFVFVASLMTPILNEGRTVEYTFFSLIELNPILRLYFRVDALGQLFATSVSSLWIVTTFYSIGYMRRMQERNQTRYYALFSLCIMAAIGVAFAGNVFTLFIFYEILSISAYPLVIHHETEEAMRAGRKYLIYILFGGALLLGSTAMTYVWAGTLSFSEVPIFKNHPAPTNVLGLLFLTYTMGFGVKAAIMPLHDWLPSAMIAPTPVSGLLHAVAVVKVGVFGIVRVIYNVFGLEIVRELRLGTVLVYVASITIIVASYWALKEDNLKRRLAYSTVSQLSYIVLGAALLTPNAIIGGVVHIAYQGLMKITLFFCAGAIFVQTGMKNVSEMNGIGKSMPLTMGAFTVAAMGMIGLPLTTGFITKWYLMIGALEANKVISVFVLLYSALLNVSYFGQPIYYAYFKVPEGEYGEAPTLMLGPILLLTALILILGTFPNLPYSPLRMSLVHAKKFLYLG